ncbi:shikimate dehydrogenase, partial [Achromatium sp. WMS3]
LRAKTAQAANTLWPLSTGQLFADNTDGIGLIRDLHENHGINLQGKSILLLGAGGAARGVLYALWQQQPSRFWIANRTATKAVELVKQLAPYRTSQDDIQGGSLEIIDTEQFDCIINATSTGLKGKMPQIPESCLIPGGIVYDMAYANEPTVFVRWGYEHGAAYALDGLGMLVEQAAESFLLWRGIRPETTKVLELLRSFI